MFEFDKSKTVCFTGHRPGKLNVSPEKIAELKEHLSATVRGLISCGYDTFITGMAEGFDIWAANTVLRYKEEGLPVKLICAEPHPTFAYRRSAEDKMEYKDILRRADYTIAVSPKSTVRCYQTRNVWMVDRASVVIALFTGESGGTKNTVNYAKRRGVKVINIWHAGDESSKEIQ